MKSYFFNAEPTTDTVEHPTGYDREYDANDIAAFFAPLFNTAGVLAGVDPDACQVYKVSDNTVGVRPGAAYVKGRLVVLDGTERVAVSGSKRIVLRMNKSADVRSFQLLAVGALVQTEDVYDLELAKISSSGGGDFELMGDMDIQDTRTYLASSVRPANSSVTDAPEKTADLVDADKFAGVNSANGKLSLFSGVRVKAWLGKAFAALAHKHAAADINAGTFLGKFVFQGNAATPVLELVDPSNTARKMQVEFVGTNPYAHIRAIKSAAEQANLRLYPTSTPAMTVRLEHITGGTSTLYRLFGEHNPITISGSYTGDGTQGRTINLGGKPKLLLVTGYDGLGLVALALITATPHGEDNDGFVIPKFSGSTLSISTVQAHLKSGNLTVGGGSTDTTARFLNVSGVTYDYYGLVV